MEREKPPQESGLDRNRVEERVAQSLQVSAGQHDVDCLDLKEKLVALVMEWFSEHKEELQKDFKGHTPANTPRFKDLFHRIEKIFDLSRLKEGGVTKEYRRSAAISVWIYDMYWTVLQDFFTE